MNFYLISPPFENKNFNEDSFDKITDIIRITYFQIRPKYKDLKKNENFAVKFFEKFKKICEKKKINFLLNDNVHLSKKLGYDGVHLGQNDMDCKNAREILGKNFSIGISCNNSIELAKKAKIEGADYVAFGPAFNSKTKKTSREVLDLNKLKKKNIGIPFTIIGGIDHSNIKKLFNIGANNFSLINSIWNFENGPVKSAIKYKELENIYEN